MQTIPKFSCVYLAMKWGASSRWSFRPNSAWGSKETTTIGKTHPTLYYIYLIHILVFCHEFHIWWKRAKIESVTTFKLEWKSPCVSETDSKYTGNNQFVYGIETVAIFNSFGSVWHVGFKSLRKRMFGTSVFRATSYYQEEESSF